MNRENTDPTRPRWLLALGVLLVGLLALGASAASAAGPGATGNLPRGNSAQASGVAPLTQQFEDVPDSNPFSTFINALYVDSVVSGYTCGSTNPPEPCVPPLDRPYYRPNNTVTRAQMAKFVDNGRKNISTAIGTSLGLTDTIGVALTISDTNFAAIYAYSASSDDSIRAQCTRANTDCYALHGFAAPGDYAAWLGGGRGVFSQSGDSNYPAVNAIANGTSATGGEFYSANYRAAQVDGPPTSNGWHQLVVIGPDINQTAESISNGGLSVAGNLVVGGSKSGYVVDAMQNADTVALQPGDVVTIAGDSGPAVIGEIPAPRVKLASTAYDTGVVGIVDQVLYVPDAATKAAYEAQEAARQNALAQRAAALAASNGEGAKADDIPIPDARITDEQGTVHAAAGQTQVTPGGYANVVTLGSYKAVKVDASFGAIHAGDLLTTSPHAGHAMKATDKLAATGAVIGKALGSLESGTGTIAVLVTLK